MQTAKQAAKQIIDHLPEQASWDDIMYELYVKQKIGKGLNAIKQGHTVSHEEAKHRAAQVIKVRWSNPALEDMEGIRDYIAKDSPFYAPIY